MGTPGPPRKPPPGVPRRGYPRPQSPAAAAGPRGTPSERLRARPLRARRAPGPAGLGSSALPEPLQEGGGKPNSLLMEGVENKRDGGAAG